MTADPEPPSSDWTINHFSKSNPAGAGQGNVATLLRSVADTLDQLGDIQVQDITFHSEVIADKDYLTVTVYYERTASRS